MSSGALENVQWIASWARQNYALAPQSSGNRKIIRVGIIGAGMMGTAIAAAHVQYRLPVVIHDVDADALGHASATIANELKKANSHVGAESFRRLVRPTTDLAEAAGCDLVLEAIAETAPAKLQLFSQLQQCLGAGTIVASNTSTIPLQRLAQGFSDASLFCGMHYCHPVHERPLVEIIYGPKTSDQTISACVGHARRIGRLPMVVPDGPGFVVNRLLFPYLGAALELLQEGCAAELIEAAAAEFGMAIGPLRLMDEIGLDTTLQAGLVLATAFPQRIVYSPLLVSLVKAGRLGRKTGAGFFSYATEKNNNSFAPSDVIPRRDLEAISLRLTLPMLLEATRLLEEDRVCDPRDIDLAMLFGLGFPAAKGGLLWWADTLGAERILALLQSPGKSGLLNEPTAILKAMAQTGERFYNG